MADVKQHAALARLQNRLLHGAWAVAGVLGMDGKRA